MDSIESDGAEIVTEPKTNSRKCIACTTADSNCVHFPCGHCIFCMDCYDIWDKKDPERFDLYSLLDEDFIEDEDEGTPTATKCPACKVVVVKVVQLFQL